VEVGEGHGQTDKLSNGLDVIIARLFCLTIGIQPHPLSHLESGRGG
jgi:hypothetical protein